MAVVRWGEFGDTVVREMAWAKAGENLLVLADTWTDLQIAEACFIAAVNAKTNAQLLVIPRMSHTDTRQLNASTAGAISRRMQHREPEKRARAFSRSCPAVRRIFSSKAPSTSTIL